MAIRTVAVPLLSGSALMLGFAAFALLRGKRQEPAQSAPRTLREAGLPEPREPEPIERSSAAPNDTGPLSERSPELLELDLEFETDPVERDSLDDSVAPEDLGAHFLARATDALSPFGGTFEQFDLDQFAMENGPMSEASARAAGGRDTLEPPAEEDEVAESERRPTSLRVGARS